MFALILLAVHLLAAAGRQPITSNAITNRLPKTAFYWNAPTMQCLSNKIFFKNLTERFQIVHNDEDAFLGEKITILYDPGAFPAILEDPETGKVVLRNGGVPQQGNFTYHLSLFKERVERSIPDPDFNGVGVIDFESWRPIYRQNFGVLVPYKDLSLKIEKQLHPFWTQSALEKEATKRFEEYGKRFMLETLKFAKKLRPRGTWGYYAYPYCFNATPKNGSFRCQPEVTAENDRISWLFESSDSLFPSVYLPEKRLTSKERVELIQGRVEEAQRVSKRARRLPGVLPYFWYKYQDTREFLSKKDLNSAFSYLKDAGVDGVILWGSSQDVNSKSQCLKLYEYVETVLGPAILED